MNKPHLRDVSSVQKPQLQLQQRHGHVLTHLGHHFFEGVHDPGALGLLEVGETPGDDHHGGQHHTEIQLERGRERERDGGVM